MSSHEEAPGGRAFITSEALAFAVVSGGLPTTELRSGETNETALTRLGYETVGLPVTPNRLIFYIGDSALYFTNPVDPREAQLAEGVSWYGNTEIHPEIHAFSKWWQSHGMWLPRSD